MAKSKKAIVPFFKLRWQSQDTLEAVANEVLLTIQAIDMAVNRGNLPDHVKEILQERAEAWRKLCMEPDDAP